MLGCFGWVFNIKTGCFSKIRTIRSRVGDFTGDCVALNPRNTEPRFSCGERAGRGIRVAPRRLVDGTSGGENSPLIRPSGTFSPPGRRGQDRPHVAPSPRRGEGVRIAHTFLLLPGGEKVPEGRMRGDAQRLTSEESHRVRSAIETSPWRLWMRKTSSSADRFDGGAAGTERPCLLIFQGLGHDCQHVGVIGASPRFETGDDVAVAIEYELFKVPADVA